MFIKKTCDGGIWVRTNFNQPKEEGRVDPQVHLRRKLRDFSNKLNKVGFV